MESQFLTSVQESFTPISIQLNFFEGINILFLALISGLYVRFLYLKFSLTFSSRVSFGNTLLVVCISVASLVAVVKASLALSLGLVGALSVIRFRTAVKEPFNLAFLLLTISMGISVGASQYLFTFLIAIFSFFSVLFSYLSTKNNGIRLRQKRDSLFNFDEVDTLSITLPPNSSLDLLYVYLKKHTEYYSLLSLDQVDEEPISIVLRVNVTKNKSLSILKDDIFKEFPGSSFSFYNSPAN